MMPQSWLGDALPARVSGKQLVLRQIRYLTPQLWSYERDTQKDYNRKKEKQSNTQTWTDRGKQGPDIEWHEPDTG